MPAKTATVSSKPYDVMLHLKMRAGRKRNPPIIAPATISPAEIRLEMLARNSREQHFTEM